MDIIRLSYLPSINRFMDTHDWCIIHTLTPYFDVWQLDEWKKKRKLISQLVDKFGNIWEIEYLTEEEEIDAFDFINYRESFGLRVIRDCY